MTVVAAAAAVLLCLSLAATALGWRHPTRGERAAIVRAAKHTPTALPQGKIRVSGIKVSTVGPWASATVTIYINNMPDYATDILHKVKGKWAYASVGTSREQCIMPPKDRQNLGFTEPCP